MSGSLTLNRGNRQYPGQTMSLEAGGVTLTQSGGAVIHQGIPFEYTPHEIGTGSLRVSLLTFVGAPFQAAGSDYAFINAQFLYANTNRQPIIRPALVEHAVEVGDTSAYVRYWAGQGAATPCVPGDGCPDHLRHFREHGRPHRQRRGHVHCR